MTKIFIRQSGQSGTFCLRIVSFNSALCLTISSSGYIRNCKPPIHTRWRNSTKLMNAAVTHCRIQNYKLNFTPEHHEGLQRSRDTVPHILNLDTKEKCCQLQAPAALSLWNPPPSSSCYWILEYRMGLQASPNVFMNRKFSPNKQPLIPRSRVLHDYLTAVIRFSTNFLPITKGEISIYFPTTVLRCPTPWARSIQSKNPLVIFSTLMLFTVYGQVFVKVSSLQVLKHNYFLIIIPFMRAKQNSMWGCRVDSSGPWWNI